MYNNNTNKDLVGAGLTAGLGAGVVTSFAVGQGQHPIMGLFITAIAVILGIVCRLYDLA